MVTSLSTRTTVFGVMNPKGNYDPGRSLAANTGLSGPLLSRFDIVLLLMDMKNPKWDEHVSSHILLSHQQVNGREWKGPCPECPVVSCCVVQFL